MLLSQFAGYHPYRYMTRWWDAAHLGPTSLLPHAACVWIRAKLTIFTTCHYLRVTPLARLCRTYAPVSPRSSCRLVPSSSLLSAVIASISGRRPAAVSSISGRQDGARCETTWKSCHLSLNDISHCRGWHDDMHALYLSLHVGKRSVTFWASDAAHQPLLRIVVCTQRATRVPLRRNSELPRAAIGIIADWTGIIY